MNMNEIYRAIQEFDLAAAIAEVREAGHVLTQTEMAGLIVAAVLGGLMCLFGLKLVRFWAAVLGLAGGAAAGYAAGTAAGLDGTMVLLISAAAGVIVAVLGAALYRVGVFLTVFLGVGLFGIHMIDPRNWILLGICAGVALVAAMLSVKFINMFTILATVLLGGVTAGPAVYYLLPETALGGILRIILCAAFGAVGMLVQLLLESRKRKRQSLKKAAQIRKENSTENEVERARAMMDELGGDIEKVEQTPFPARAEQDAFFETVSLDDIDDIEDEDEIFEESEQEDPEWKEPKRQPKKRKK